LQTVLSSSTAILLTAALYAVCPLIQPWNCFLYTDALFMHLMLISLFLLVYPFKKPPLKTSVALLLVLPFFRPVGFLCILLAMAVWIIKGSKKHAAYIISFSGYFLLITIFLRYCLTHPSDFFYPNHNSEANIICGYPSSLEAYIRSPYQPGESMFHFFVSNPSMTWRLFTNRLFKAFWMTRPYFSQKHNFYLSIFLIVHYSIAVLGIFVFFFRKLYKKEGYLFIGLLLFSLPIIVFCADWVNRFILPALVFVYFFIGLGVDLLFQQYAGFKVRPESAI
jgi:hypothetical protein